MKNTLYYKELFENHNIKRLKIKDFIETCDSLELVVVELDTSNFPDSKIVPQIYSSMKEYQDAVLCDLEDVIFDVEGIKNGVFEMSAAKNIGPDHNQINFHFEVSGQCVLIHRQEK